MRLITLIGQYTTKIDRRLPPVRVTVMFCASFIAFATIDISLHYWEWAWR